jgi:outer membrane protein OmpA-like peptidoglycan-associated protein
VTAVRRLAAALALLALAGCGGLPTNVLVLLANDDGSPSAVAVTTAAGTSVVDAPLTALSLADAARKPTKPVTVTDATVRHEFAGALAATPRAPERFVLGFASGSAEVTQKVARQVAEIAAMAKTTGAPDIDIIGNTDRAGTNAFNENLSRRRAEVVRRRLIAAGIPPESIHASWYGASNPLAATPKDGHQPRNRRDEVTVR